MSDTILEITSEFKSHISIDILRAKEQAKNSIKEMISTIVNRNDDTKSVCIEAANIRMLLGELGKNPILCFGVNPSTADLHHDDPTIKKIKKIASENCCDGWLMMNLSPQRSTDPQSLVKEDMLDSSMMEKNLLIIEAIFELFPNSITLAAWGDNIDIRKYLHDSWKRIADIQPNRTWYIRGPLTKSGNPRHQLYVPDKTPLKKAVVTETGDFQE